jgi:hypothetical protein
MMGNRGYRGGEECDAFSRRWRRLLIWRRGELRRIKRQFAKRVRKAARRSARVEAQHDA